MALTISEANAVNDLLDYVLDLRKDRPAVPRAEAQEAAELLAEHAHKALSAGIRPVDIAQAWQRLPQRPTPRRDGYVAVEDDPSDAAP